MEDTTKGYLMLRWKDDDKPKFSNERFIDCGAVGETGCFVSQKQMGVYRGRVYQIRLTDDRPVIICAAEEDVEVMPW